MLIFYSRRPFGYRRRTAWKGDRECSVNLLKKFKSKGNVEQAEKQAIAFKQEKLMQLAQKLLSDSAYKDFESIIYPERQKGKVHARMTKAQAIENLKQYKMSIQKSVAVVYPSDRPYGSAFIEQSFCSCRLARVHVGKQRQTYMPQVFVLSP